VAEKVLDVLQGHALCQQERRGGVPQVMEACVRKLGSEQGCVERARHRRQRDERERHAPKHIALSKLSWAEFDETAARVSAELRPGVRGGGRSRDQIVRHVLANEGGDFSKRVKAESELEEVLTPAGLAHHRDRYVEAMRAWYADGQPLGKWTIPYLLRHTAYHVLDHTWEMQDRDLTSR
jgi:hypothetical protein